MPIDELTTLIEAAHQRITHDTNIVADAIECGRLLTEAREMVWAEGDLWIEWLRENVTVHPTTAYDYMRLYRYRDKIHGITTLSDAVALISKKSLTAEMISEIKRLHDGGKGLTQVELATLFGVRKSTINYHVNSKARNRSKSAQREQRKRERRALDREREQIMVKSAGGPTSVAYEHIRKVLIALEQAAAESQPYERRAQVHEAMQRAYDVEDAIVHASRLS
jgi:transposase